jgi:RHS repeat-associated protein
MMPFHFFAAGTITLGYKQYELSNHLGNVLTTIADNVIRTAPAMRGGQVGLMARIVSTQDYYPFGMCMVERAYQEPTVNSERNYRFGFNGKENDEDWGKTIQDYGFRLYNPALGKFLSVDPLTQSYPELTPYQFASNSPIFCIDIDGLEGTTYEHTVQPGETIFSIVSYYRVKKGCNVTPERVAAANPSKVDKQFGTTPNTVLTIPCMPSLPTTPPAPVPPIAQPVVPVEQPKTLSEEEANVRAFLTLIRSQESGGYGLVTPYNSTFGNGRFGEGLSDDERYVRHPKVTAEGKWDNTKYKSKSGVESPVAGGYQFQPKTYLELLKVKGIENNFCPENQDIMAISLLSFRGALDDVKNGRIKEAIDKIKVNEWTSFQIGTYESMKKEFDAYKKAEQEGRSLLSTPQGQLNINIDHAVKKK